MSIAMCLCCTMMLTAARYRVHYDDEKLRISSETMQENGTNGYEHTFIDFENKTNNTLRVQYKATAVFVRYAQRITKTETIYIKPQGRTSVYLATYAPDLIYSIIGLDDFELINYAEKKEDKEVPW